MANTSQSDSRRRATRRAAPGGLPWVSELQLEAYLQARDALRKARAASWPSASPATPAAPPAAS